MVSKLDAIGRVMVFKSQFHLSHDAFDGMLIVFGSLLPEGHVLPKSMYESQKLLRASKMSYEQIHACSKGCVLFRKEHVETKYCPKCKSSRYMEVDSGDGQKRQLNIPKNPTVPSVHTEDQTDGHDREINETDDMAQKW
jgi:hypothetical protein